MASAKKSAEVTKRLGSASDEIGREVIAEHGSGPSVSGSTHGISEPSQIAERHGEEAERRDQEGAGEAAEQIVELADPGRADDRPEAGLVVAHDDVGDEGGRDEHVEDREDQHGSGRSRTGAFSWTLPPAPPIWICSLATKPKDEQEEQDGGDPEDRVLAAGSGTRSAAILANMRALLRPRGAACGEGREIDVLEPALDRREAVARIAVRQHVDRRCGRRTGGSR